MGRQVCRGRCGRGLCASWELSVAGPLAAAVAAGSLPCAGPHGQPDPTVAACPFGSRERGRAGATEQEGTGSDGIERLVAAGFRAGHHGHGHHGRAGPSRPSAVVPVALDDRDRPRHRLDPRRSGGHHRRQCRRPSRRGRQRPRHHRRPGHRCRRRPLRGGCLLRGTVLRLADRPLRPQEALHGDPDRLPGRDRDDRAVVRVLVVLPLPLPHRLRDRRRVRGHQLGDRRADPVPLPGPGRPHHQRQLLAGRDRRRPAVRGDAGHRRLSPEPRLAAQLRSRGRPRPGHPARPPARSGESALAVHPRQGGGRRGAGVVRGATDRGGEGRAAPAAGR